MSEDPTRLLPNDDLRVMIMRLQETVVTRFDALDMEVATLKQRQAALEEKVDRRLQETRPIWEAVLARQEAFEHQQKKFEDEIVREMKRMRREFMSVFNMINETHPDFRGDVEEGLDKLEGRTAA